MSDRPTSILSRYIEPAKPASEPGGMPLAEGYIAMLEFVLGNGNRIALPYATLLRVLYNPSSGIRLVFSTDDVEIAGINLDEVYRGIVQHRLPRVEVHRTRPGFETGPGVVVTGITVVPKDG